MKTLLDQIVEGNEKRVKDKRSKTHSLLDECNNFLVKIGLWALSRPPALTLLSDPQPSALVPGLHDLLVFMKFLQQSIYFWITFPLLLWSQLFWNKLNSQNILGQLSVRFCVTNVISFSYDKEPLISKTELRTKETFVKKVISSVDP